MPLSYSTAPPQKIALILQGGGARGAYEVGVLKAIAEINLRRVSPFQIVCGASVGAINAARVAATSTDFQRGIEALEALWSSLTCNSVYDTRALPLLIRTGHWALALMFGRFGFHAPDGLLDSAPLHHLLTTEFDRRHLEHVIHAGALSALCISTSSYGEGKAVTFFEAHDDIAPWSRSRREGVPTRIGPQHLLASSALPFVFAPVRIKGRYYGDGALRLTSPLSPAIHTGADKIVIIATRDNLPIPAADRAKAQTEPTVGDMAGVALDILFNDNLETDHERLSRINQTLALLTPEARQKTPLRFIDTIFLAPSQDLRPIAQAHAHRLPAPIRLLMHSVGSWGHDGRLESYLLFEAGYIGALIDLGYRDTIARADELAAFLFAS
ncbi:patatin-like phospholipase family protein [Phaeovulum sp.]|uniref:patatin-like phospholipase family protein n=1 Tax=Phaeovulum sp. TaxID=2934796 RepID=UPI0039E5DBB4